MSFLQTNLIEILIFPPLNLFSFFLNKSNKRRNYHRCYVSETLLLKIIIEQCFRAFLMPFKMHKVFTHLLFHLL